MRARDTLASPAVSPFRTRPRERKRCPPARNRAHAAQHNTSASLSIESTSSPARLPPRAYVGGARVRTARAARTADAVRGPAIAITHDYGRDFPTLVSPLVATVQRIREHRDRIDGLLQLVVVGGSAVVAPHGDVANALAREARLRRDCTRLRAVGARLLQHLRGERSRALSECPFRPRPSLSGTPSARAPSPSRFRGA